MKTPQTLESIQIAFKKCNIGNVESAEIFKKVNDTQLFWYAFVTVSMFPSKESCDLLYRIQHKIRMCFVNGWSIRKYIPREERVIVEQKKPSNSHWRLIPKEEETEKETQEPPSQEFIQGLQQVCRELVKKPIEKRDPWFNENIFPSPFVKSYGYDMTICDLVKIDNIPSRMSLSDIDDMYCGYLELEREMNKLLFV